MRKEINILFWGSPVPDNEEYRLPGFSRAGNLAQRGIAEGLFACCGKRLSVLGFQPIQAWPRYKRLWMCGRTIKFESGLSIHLFPSLNILLARELFRGLIAFFSTIIWCLKYSKDNRTILTYNLYTPPFPFIYCAAKLTRTPIVPIIFDIGLPPGSLGRLRDWIYHHGERVAKRYIPQAQGVCVIVDKIRDIYAPCGHALRVDGGVSPDVLRRLFALDRSAQSSKIRLVMAGSVAPHNGIDLLLEALKRLPQELPIVVDVAGVGSGYGKLKAEASKDARLVAHGLLDLDELFLLYQDADVILNLRITEGMDTSTWFPSKFLEALVCGRCVLTTNVAHIKETYGKYCVVLEEETPEAVVSAIKKIMNMGRDKRDGIGRDARAYILSAHTWEKQARRIVMYCQGIVNHKFNNCIGMVQI